MNNSLTMWTIYDHPSDHPENFVARRWEITAGVAKPTTDLIITPELAGLRGELSERGLYCIPRNAEDDVKIVETWI